MASNLEAMASNLEVMASNLLAMACNLLAMASNILQPYMAMELFRSRLHNLEKVVYMDPYEKEILGVVPFTLKPLY